MDTELLIDPDTLRGLIPDGGADVGVIVTDGVMVRFEPVRGNIELVRSAADELLPAVRVAPPGSDDRGGGRIVVFDRPV